jgi:hypothetical protein
MPEYKKSARSEEMLGQLAATHNSCLAVLKRFFSVDNAIHDAYSNCTHYQKPELKPRAHGAAGLVESLHSSKAHYEKWKAHEGYFSHSDACRIVELCACLRTEISECDKSLRPCGDLFLEVASDKWTTPGYCHGWVCRTVRRFLEEMDYIVTEGCHDDARLRERGGSWAIDDEEVSGYLAVLPAALFKEAFDNEDGSQLYEIEHHLRAEFLKARRLVQPDGHETYAGGERAEDGDDCDKGRLRLAIRREGKEAKPETVIKTARINRQRGRQLLRLLEEAGEYDGFARATPEKYRANRSNVPER